MKRVYIIFGIFLVACECFCVPIFDKITEVDNQMNNGKVEYVLRSSDKFLGTQRIVLSYLEDGIFKKVYYFEKGYHFTKYFDGNDVIGVTDGSHGSPSIALYSRSEVDKAYPFADVLSKASCVYGRGLSKLDLSNVSINNNILTGKYHSWLITAYLDPKYDYAFYKLEIKFENGKTVSTLINSNPILVDNKFYIFSKSSYRDVNKSLNRDITINSVTFVPPDKKDIEFDWKKSNLPVVDTRVNDLPVGYSRESLGNDITSEKLLKKSEKNVKEIYSDKNVKKSDNPRNKIIILCISVLLFILVLSIFIHSIKKKK
ncbi:MAG: hypothetical protein IJS60_05435 [Abditibacteriota bacterium]|nr:hypothetical protein [Abditibacteriota bacterium]